MAQEDGYCGNAFLCPKPPRDIQCILFSFFWLSFLWFGIFCRNWDYPLLGLRFFSVSIGVVALKYRNVVLQVITGQVNEWLSTVGVMPFMLIAWPSFQVMVSMMVSTSLEVLRLLQKLFGSNRKHKGSKKR
jgi:hypothetical protein